LNEGPWAFDGSILLLKQMNGDEQPSEMEFTTARFWVKICDLPMKKTMAKYVTDVTYTVTNVILM